MDVSARMVNIAFDAYCRYAKGRAIQRRSNMVTASHLPSPPRKISRSCFMGHDFPETDIQVAANAPAL